MRQWFVVFTVGPGLVGPFETEKAADTWAHRYDREYQQMHGPHTLSWRVRNSAPPESLEWWG